MGEINFYTPRPVMPLNDEWRFILSDSQLYSESDYNDTSWRQVALPHDWSIEGPFSPDCASATGYLPGGIGWYRKTFILPKRLRGKQVYIEFDGVYCGSDVWVNGTHIGRRPNGFIPFRYDITDSIDWMGLNTIAVRVDHTHFADARWYTGSGINRNVRLVFTNPVHIKPWGVYATSQLISLQTATVSIDTEIVNRMESQSTISVKHSILDTEDNVLALTEITPIINPDKGSVNSRLQLTNPNLWSPESPYLYRLQTTLLEDEQVIDEVETLIGIRSIHFDADTGFYLNGVNMKLKGVCIHDDAGALGTAVPIGVWERRLQILKTAGVNAIRMAHNPHMPELYDLCDRMGFLVQDEAFDEWEEAKNKWVKGWNVDAPSHDGTSAYFTQWHADDLRDCIISNRNHPSIIMWSIGNEIDYPNDPYTHEILAEGTNPQSYGRGFQPENPHSDRLGEIARSLVEICKNYDKTRPITAAISAALISNETGFADALDIVGYNYQEYRYKDDHITYPTRVLYGSENGMAYKYWQAVEENPYISGQFLWTGIDYLGEAHQWPSRSNSAGLLDLAGFPKPEYYFRRSIWTDEPMVYIGTTTPPDPNEQSTLWTHNKGEAVWTGTIGEPIRINSFTNCEEVELVLNDVSLGSKRITCSTNHVLSWDTNYQPGEIIAKGYINGILVATHILNTPGKAARLQVHQDKDRLFADGEDVAHISIKVVDDNWVTVYDSDIPVTVSIEGPAKLLGLENGNHNSHEDYKAPSRKVYHGRLLAYLQAQKTQGSARITISAPGLESVVIDLCMVENSKVITQVPN